MSSLLSRNGIDHNCLLWKYCIFMRTVALCGCHTASRVYILCKHWICHLTWAQWPCRVTRKHRGCDCTAGGETSLHEDEIEGHQIARCLQWESLSCLIARPDIWVQLDRRQWHASRLARQCTYTTCRDRVESSGFVLVKVSVRSPRKLVIFIMLMTLIWIKLTNKLFI